MRLTLSAIKFGCDFRRSEMTLYDELRKEPKFKQVELTPGRVILFVSCSENQLIWLFAAGELEGYHGKKAAIIDSRRWRILHGTWNPQMLANYARLVGIELTGIRLFETGFKQEREERRRVRTLDEAYEPHAHFAGGK